MINEESKSEILKNVHLLGYNAVDKVTGFSGMISTMSFDAYGCVQAVLTPRVKDDGSVNEGRWFDITRLEIDETQKLVDMPNYHSGYVATGKKGAAEKPAM